MSPELARLSIRTKQGLTIYKAGLNNNGDGGYIQDFSRDSLEASETAHDYAMLRDQLIFGNLHQAKVQNPLNGAEPFKFHHQFPGVVFQRGLSTEYNASDAVALYLIGHADYQQATGDRSLTEEFRDNLQGAVEVYTFSHIDSDTHQFVEDPKFCGAEDFALKRTDWKDSIVPKRDNGEPIYPVRLPNLQAQYMAGLRAASTLFNTREFAREAEKMRKGLQALFDYQRGTFHIAVDKLGPIPGVSSDPLNMMAYLDLEDLDPWQWEAIVKSSEVLETVAGYQNTDPEIAKDMPDDYHARVWPKEDANMHRGASNKQLIARQEGLHSLVDAFGHVMEVSFRTYGYLDSEPETLKVHDGMVEKAGMDPQLWTVTAKQYFRSVQSLTPRAA